ncbi:MAG: ImmA/IrrE family metallo-endopeptidase [Clostridiales bacterium]|nr:ImmA/IrrE family metallo-endopeptidase [Clostridiales bacterium]
MDYRDYQKARDASWRILLDCKIDRLPVDLNAVCRKLKIRLFSYTAAADIIERAHMADATRRTDGLTFYMRGTPVILYNGAVLPQRVSFTVAHELGHIVLAHVKPGSVTIANREPHPGDSPEETAANQFAARLLAPACVLWAMNIHTPEEIMNLCQISRAAAEFRARRMADLYRRGQFLTSPLEQAVYQQFRPFIAEALNPPPGE